MRIEFMLTSKTLNRTKKDCCSFHKEFLIKLHLSTYVTKDKDSGMKRFISHKIIATNEESGTF